MPKEARSGDRRQDAPVAWQPNGLVYVVKRDLVSSDFSLPMPDSVGFPMEWEASINIDNLWQYQMAELLWSNRQAGA